MKKYRKLIGLAILLLLIITVVVIKGTRKNTIIYYYKEKGLSYIQKNKIYQVSDKNIMNIRISQDNKKVLYIDYPYLYLYNTSNKKAAKIKENILYVEWLDNNNYIVLDMDNNLYLYNNKKEKLIEKKIDSIRMNASPYIIYEKKDKSYIYNIKRKNKKELKMNNISAISDDHNNFIINDNGTLKIIRINNNKERIKLKDITKYQCISDNCEKFYYFNKKGQLGKYNGKETIIAETANNLLAYDKKNTIYSYLEDDNYKLIVNNNRKTITLDQNKTSYNEVILDNNKVYYLTGGIVREIKINGSKKKKLNEDVTDILEVMNDKVLLLKNKDLYLNDKLIGEQIETETIKVFKNNIYYLKKKKDIPSLYKNNGKKEIKVKENVGSFTIQNNKIYYIGDYNISQKYGNLYQYKKGKVLDKRVISFATE